MSKPRRVLLVGATGLVGRKIIARGRNVPDLTLVALARREMRLPRGARMEMMLAATRDWPQAIGSILPDVVICALGTTKAKSGPEGLRMVDQDLVANVADASVRAGVCHFVMISSVGADAHSRTNYLSIKGKAEERLGKLGFRRLDILRPGLLRGRRWNDRRPVERLGQLASPLTDLLLHGERRRYRSIEAADVAAAALQAARANASGTFVHEHDSLLHLAKGLRRELGPAKSDQ